MTVKLAYRLMVFISEKPGDCLGQLELLSQAVKDHHWRLAVQLFGKQGISKGERRLLRLHGWQGCTGTRTDAAEYLAQSASSALLVQGNSKLRELVPQLAEVVVRPPPPPPPPPAPRPKPKPKPKPQAVPKPKPQAVPKPTAPRKAAFLVATHHRPKLLAASLRHLSLQTVPAGWEYEILVGGEPHDAGREVAAAVGATFVAVGSPKVTDKLNQLARTTDAELLLMADDDDLQPMNRLITAVAAFEQGAMWSASGIHLFVNTTDGRISHWEGRASTGHVGTSVSVARSFFLRVNGYPSVPSGKDGHLAHRLHGIKAPFKDISIEIGEDLVCLQHAENLNTRPFPRPGQRRSKGKFKITGLPTNTPLPLAAQRTVTGILSPDKVISIAITTCNRPDGCLRLLEDIDRDTPDSKVIHVAVFDDGSTADYSAVKRYLQTRGWLYFRAPQNHGKKLWWRWVNKVLTYWQAAPAAHYYFIQDDIRLCEDFFTRTIALWDTIRHRDKVSLYLLRDASRSKVGMECWTSFKSRVEGKVERTQWVDCNAFLCNTEFLTRLGASLHPIHTRRWDSNPTLSSGVGRQFSLRLDLAKGRLYRSLHSYVLHVDVKSQMNPEARKRDPLQAVRFIDEP